MCKRASAASNSLGYLLVFSEVAFTSDSTVGLICIVCLLFGREKVFSVAGTVGFDLWEILEWQLLFFLDSGKIDGA